MFQDYILLLALCLLETIAIFQLLNSIGNQLLKTSSSLSFGLFPIRGRHSRYLHFYNMAFVLRSDALPATNPLFAGKTGNQLLKTKLLNWCLARRNQSIAELVA